MIELVPSKKLVDLLSTAVESPGAEAAAAVVRASDEEAFHPRVARTAELLKIYDTRLRMGRLDSVAGGRAFAVALRSLQDAEVLMVVVESSAGTASVWLTIDGNSVVGTVAFPVASDQATP